MRRIILFVIILSPLPASGSIPTITMGGFGGGLLHVRSDQSGAVGSALFSYGVYSVASARVQMEFNHQFPASRDSIEGQLGIGALMFFLDLGFASPLKRPTGFKFGLSMDWFFDRSDIYLNIPLHYVAIPGEGSDRTDEFRTGLRLLYCFNRKR